MSDIAALAQIAFTLIVGMYFFMHLKNESGNDRDLKKEYSTEAENLNRLRHIRLNEPMSECSRPSNADEIIGQEDGIKALRAALWGANPQHVLIYGPPGVGKTAAARIIMEEVKKSADSPFKKDAPFIETDATIMRRDEYGFADPLIGSVHDPIYQGAGLLGQSGIPQPKIGAVTKAHGGILFIDEIGELPNEQINKLLKVLEDRRVNLESSYYNSSMKKIPPYIRDIFDNGLPADFRLIGATTAEPKKIPDAIRSRCIEVYFNKLTRGDILKIVGMCATRCSIAIENGVKEIIADYAQNGRDAVKILQCAYNLSKMEERCVVSREDAKWVIKANRYEKREDLVIETDKIVDISLIKPFN